jgi:beta-glucosidase
MQVENSTMSDGAGSSIWDTFVAKNPSLIKDGSSPRVTCDETNHWREDIGLMRDLGINSYRFSISWPRVLPEGRGRVNESGVAFYDRFIDALLQAGIKPFVTIFHFDYPDSLQQQTGWLSPDSPRWLADYSALLAARYSDRVDEWLTINEPNIFWAMGQELGIMAPGTKLSESDLALGMHHMLLGHGLAVQAIRASAKRPVKIGLPFAGPLSVPASNSERDVEAARLASFTARPIQISPNAPAVNTLSTALWLDPVFRGAYPEEASPCSRISRDTPNLRI